MNTTFATPTNTFAANTFPGSFPWNWNNFTGFIGNPYSFTNTVQGFPIGGYGYGPNGWWIGAHGQNAYGQGGVPQLGNLWNNFGFGMGAPGWNTSTPWSTNFGTNPFSWNAHAGFAQTLGSPISPNFIPQPNFLSNVPTPFTGHFGQPFATGFVPGLTNSFNGFVPQGSFGFTPFTTPWNVNNWSPIGWNTTTPTTPWNATPWNTNATWANTPWQNVTPWNNGVTGYTPATTVNTSTNGATFGYPTAFPTPFGNCVPSQGACAGREAA